MIKISYITPREVRKGYHARFVHTGKVTLAFWEVEKGAVLPLHQHIHEQTTEVLEGRFEMTVDGKTEVYEPGTIVVIAPNIIHGGVALTPCRLFDVFAPVREDYR